jgi:CpeT/CpcT family (DUF1001)
MKRHYRDIFFAFLLAFYPAVAHTVETVSIADYQQFVSWWAGDYDNLAQNKAQELAGRAQKDRNQPALLFVRKVDLPAFGSEVYYAEWRDANEPTKVTRQRLYGFEIDPAEQKLRLNLHIWPADKPEFVARTSGAHLDTRKLSGVTPADMVGLKGCDVYFDIAADSFSGAMKKGACAFPAPNGTPIYSWSQMKLTPTQFSYLDGWFNLDGTPFMRFPGEWYVFDKKK